jgi:signal transduction histidine kinase
MRRVRRRPSLRLRITAGALVVLVAALCGAGLLVLDVVRDTMTGQIDAALEADADFTERAMTRGPGLPMGEGPTDLYVQFVSADGKVVAAGTAAAHLPALAPPRTNAGRRITTRHDPTLGQIRVLVEPSPTDPDTTLVLARSSAHVGELRDSLIKRLAALVVVGSVALAALVWFAVGRALRPVDRMRRTVDRIGARDLHQRLDCPGTGDELDELADTLNALLQRLDHAVMREAQFVADASHELRTPIAGIRAILETESTDPAEVVRHRAEALARLALLQQLVDELLLLAKADTAPDRPTRPVDLDDLVLVQARQLRETTNLRIDTSRVSGGQVVGIDTDLGRLVENLASNAARYARTTVRFSVQPRDDTVEFTVADDGPGIAAEDADRVFERFRTLDDARGSDRAGSGLGLSIAAAIVAGHGGTIRVDEEPGGGACFVVLIRASPASGRDGRRPLIGAEPR